jgi:hypothetical protein
VTWFKVDDNLPTHRKVLAIPRRDRAAAIGLWTLAGAWCAKNLTDGHLGAHMLEELASSKKYADLLVRVGLWEATEQGYLFHDWSSPWQPTRAEVEAKREEEAKRKAEWRARRAAEKAAGRTPDHDGTDEPVPPPVPPGQSTGRPPDETRDTDVSPTGVPADPYPTRTRPDPVSPNGDTPSLRSGGAQRRATRIPDDFYPDDDLRSWARDRGFTDPQIDEITGSFVRHWEAESGAKASKLDWRKAWQNWLAKEDPRRVRVPSVAGRQLPSWEL